VWAPVTEDHPAYSPLAYNTPLKLQAQLGSRVPPGLDPLGIYMAQHVMTLCPVVAKKMIYGYGGIYKGLLC